MGGFFSFKIDVIFQLKLKTKIDIIFFFRYDYRYSKTKMTWFLKSIDFYLWKVIQNRYNIPTKIENEVSIPKSIHE